MSENQWPECFRQWHELDDKTRRDVVRGLDGPWMPERVAARCLRQLATARSTEDCVRRADCPLPDELGRHDVVCHHCGARHHNGKPNYSRNVFRCLRCGRSFGYYHPDPKIDAKVRADIAIGAAADPPEQAPAEDRGTDGPWPLSSVLRELCLAARILLDDHDYDGHGHELIRAAQLAGQKYLAQLGARTAKGAAVIEDTE